MRRQQQGQAIVFGLLFLAVTLMALLILYNQGLLVSQRVQLENAADATVYSQAKLAARNQNFIAYTNRSMVANETSIGQMVALLTWARRYGQIPSFTSFPLYSIPIAPPSPVTFRNVLDVITLPYVIAGNAVATPVSVLVRHWPTVVSYFNAAVGVFQKIFAVATLAAQVEVSMGVVEDHEDSPDDPDMYIPLIGWYFFTQNALLTYFGENFSPTNLASLVGQATADKSWSADAEDLSKQFLADQVGELDSMIQDNSPGLSGKKAKNSGGANSHMNTGEAAEAKAVEAYKRYAAIVNHNREPFTEDRHWDLLVSVPDLIPRLTLSLGIISITIDLDLAFTFGVFADGGTAFMANGALSSDADIGKLGWSSIDVLSFGIQFFIGLYVEIEVCLPIIGCNSATIIDLDFDLEIGLPLGAATHQVVRSQPDAKRLMPEWGWPGQSDTGKWGGDPEDVNNNGAFAGVHAVTLLWGNISPAPGIYGLAGSRDVTTSYAGPPSFFSLGDSFQSRGRSYEFTAAVARTLDDSATTDSDTFAIRGNSSDWDNGIADYTRFDVQTRGRTEGGDFAAGYQRFIWNDDRPMMTISSAETYFANPMQTLSDGSAEPASLFSPFWDARLREPSAVASLIATGEIDFTDILDGIPSTAIGMVGWLLSAIGERLVDAGVDYLLSEVPPPVDSLIEDPLRDGAHHVTDLAIDAVINQLEDFVP